MKEFPIARTTDRVVVGTDEGIGDGNALDTTDDGLDLPIAAMEQRIGLLASHSSQSHVCLYYFVTSTMTA